MFSEKFGLMTDDVVNDLCSRGIRREEVIDAASEAYPGQTIAGFAAIAAAAAFGGFI